MIYGIILLEKEKVEKGKKKNFAQSPPNKLLLLLI